MAGRRIQDYTQSVSVALPNAANTVNTNGLDLGKTTPFPLQEEITVTLTNTQSTGANNKNINISIQDSADNGNWANIAVLNPAIQIVANTANFPATTLASPIADITLPPGTRRYIRAQATGEANGGNSSDGTLTLQLLF